MSEAAETMKRLLNDALVAMTRGDNASDADRRAKAISALVKAEREVGELMAAPVAPSVEEDEQSRRAELRRRIAVFVDASRAGAPDDVLQRIAATGSAQ
ncbi:hypothetical protein [Terricaulis silvestris]|uniref:hypothetical protein n=1 Tax=Terricaulis silvestris TaxID=2686094 RepID=UPI00131E3AC1|nr:hypothetical protein [Terricaulis silvestris]